MQKRFINLDLSSADAITNLFKSGKVVTSETEVKINFESMVDEHFKSLNVEDPVVQFTREAYDKMYGLIDSCAKEIAWHGTVERRGMNFLVSEILVYPQIVAAATVDADEEKYVTWNMGLTNDQVNNMRLQGHSHVNMAPNPSGTDEGYYLNLLEHVEDFYLIIIMNKRKEYTLRLYDMQQNLVYHDIKLSILEEDIAKEWAKEQIKEYITEKTYPGYGRTHPKSGFPYESAEDYTDNYWQSQYQKKQEENAQKRHGNKKPIKEKLPEEVKVYWNHATKQVSSTAGEVVGTLYRCKKNPMSKIALAPGHCLIKINKKENIGTTFEWLEVDAGYLVDVVYALAFDEWTEPDLAEYSAVTEAFKKQGTCSFFTKKQKFEHSKKAQKKDETKFVCVSVAKKVS